MKLRISSANTGKARASSARKGRSPQVQRLLDLKPLEWKGNHLEILDQTELPTKTIRRRLEDVEDVAEAIRALCVRGAPLIGIAGAYGTVLAIKKIFRIKDKRQRLKAWKLTLRRLMATRPTAVNLHEAIKRMASVGEPLLKGGASAREIMARLEAEARQVEREEAERCLKMGAYGAALIPPKARVLTICNTGALATGGIGTAHGVIRIAHEQGKIAQVWVAETRPLLQGSRLTAFEMEALGIPYRIVTDGAVGALFSHSLVDVVVAGADRIARNGDTANKVGTLTIFGLAKIFGIPAYIVAPVTTFDAHTPAGDAIPIEVRSEAEVLKIGGVPVAPEGARAFNPAFDVTPASFITAFITDKGVYKPEQLTELFRQK